MVKYPNSEAVAYLESEKYLRDQHTRWWEGDSSYTGNRLLSFKDDALGCTDYDWCDCYKYPTQYYSVPPMDEVEERQWLMYEHRSIPYEVQLQHNTWGKNPNMLHLDGGTEKVCTEDLFLTEDRIQELRNS